MNSLRHTLIVGLGITGLSCLRFLQGRDRLTLLDTRVKPDMLAAAQREFPDVDYVCGDIPGDVYVDVDRIIVSPGVALESDFLSGASDLPLVSDIDIFLEHADAPVLGITGTNGKSTVTDLCGRLLSGVGLNVAIGGNLGVAALDLLDESIDVYVLELSSFQLERLAIKNYQTERTKPLSVGCLLNIASDHLDRHGSFQHYVEVKRRIYALSENWIFNRQDSATFPEPGEQPCLSFGAGLPGQGDWGLITQKYGNKETRYLSRSGEAFLDVAALGLHGAHNELNVLAALALATTQYKNSDDFKEPLLSYTGLDHRCQRVASSEGITFINDSKATNVAACLAALEGLGNIGEKNIVLIAGGDAKAADLSELKNAIGRFVKSLIVMGKDAGAMAAVAPKPDAVYFAENMVDAVQHAFHEASTGDVVLLSPACASLDMYSGFEARGTCFAECANQVIRCE
ncbi:MAG: UDP-N-acetylmuramoyl-L-alanine--D-glutamate ligase [Pseudomonadales bacterium]|nr:UDP-N-acetylmuramoyl-L-alanine--D-glutamate ligase [Pseudomonadales bacterium]